MKPNGDQRPEVLIISKPVVRPWNDSAKNIVKDQVTNSARYSYRVMTTDDRSLESDNIVCESIYPGQGKYSAGLKQNLKVMWRGMQPGKASLYHYFFAPNKLSSSAGRIQRKFARVKTVQTICSQPASFEAVQKLLFTDMLIVLSRDTKQKLLQAGIPESRVRYIPPGIEPIAPLDLAQKARVRASYGIDTKQMILFPGDYEFSNAANTTAAAAPRLLKENPDATLVFACRIKREPSLVIQNRIKKELAPLGNRVVFLNEVDEMPRLVGAADLILMPQENLYAKMDVPLVLLEAMSQKVPLVLANTPPICELLEFNCGLGIEPSDADGLANGASEILQNSKMAISLGEAGRNAILEQFSAKNMAKQIETLYDELLGN